MPKVKLFDQQEALKRAMELFWKQGYNATSMSDLVDHMGISRGSFYDTFQSKRAVFDQVLSIYKDANVDMLEKTLNSEPNVKTGLRNLFFGNVREMIADQDHKGCFMANSCSELSNSDPMVRELLVNNYTRVHEIFSAYIAKGTLRNNIEPAAFADLLITLMMGINQEVKFNATAERYERSITLVMDMLED